MITIDGIDIKNDIISYVNNLEDVANKHTITNYLIEVYDQCVESKK